MFQRLGRVPTRLLPWLQITERTPRFNKLPNFSFSSRTCTKKGLFRESFVRVRNAHYCHLAKSLETMYKCSQKFRFNYDLFTRNKFVYHLRVYNMASNTF